jgi:predicted phosphodiesterase
MRLLILSDLHVELSDLAVSTRADLDVAILAGDIGRPGDASVRWAQPSEALMDRTR